MKYKTYIQYKPEHYKTSISITISCKKSERLIAESLQNDINNLLEDNNNEKDKGLSSRSRC